MSILITVPGADFSAIGNPRVNKLLFGFPVDNLEALHFFESGNTGDVYAGPAIDQSGKGNNAPLIAGSTALKTAGGVGNVADSNGVANNGFAVLSPVPITDRFTVFGVSRNLYPAAAMIGTFLVPWSSSGNYANAGAPTFGTSAGGANVATDGRLHINQVNQANGSADNAEIAMYDTIANASTRWGGGSVRPAVATSGTPKASWIAWALSFDKAVGPTFRSLGQTITDASPADATAWANGQIGRGAKHVFGAVNYLGDSDGVKGEMALAGVYKNVSKSVSELDAIIAAMKARLALRNLTVL